MESTIIPDNFDYRSLSGIKAEAVERLEKVRPVTIGQAMRITGVDPSHISLILVKIESMNRKKRG